MALVSHISPHAAKKLHESGLLSETAKEQIERRNKLVKRIWVLVALIFGLTTVGVTYLVNSSQSDKTVTAQRSQI
jgi:heme/copper-type cytochrome/quinol oxidase subunit 3